MRTVYRLLSLLGDFKSLTRGPAPFVRRKGRQAAHQQFGPTMRKLLKP